MRNGNSSGLVASIMAVVGRKKRQKMIVIADPETGGIETSCLAISWKLPDICQVQRCNEKTYAILCFTAEETPTKKSLNVVICKKHYEEAKEKGSVKWKFDL